MRKLSTFLLFALALPYLVHGQKVYKTDYATKDGLLASLTYDYKEGKGKKKILDGKYSLYIQDKDSAKRTDFFEQNWVGSWKDNKRDGIWDFKIQHHHLIVLGVEDFKARTSLVSSINDLRGEYQAGNPVGQWNYTVNQMHNGKPLGEQISSTFSFSDSIIHGPFSYQTPSFSVTGSINKGRMNGEWEFIYWLSNKKVRELRRYDQGFILSILKLKNEDTLSYVKYDNVEKKLNELRSGNTDNVIAITDRLFGSIYDEGYDQIAEELTAQIDGNKYLNAVKLEISKMDTSITAHGHLRFCTSRFVHRISKNRASVISTLKGKSMGLKEIVRQIVKDPLLRMNHSMTDSASMIYAYFQKMKSEVAASEKMIEFMQTDSVKLLDPYQFTSRFSAYFPNSRMITYESNHEQETKIISYNPADWKGTYTTLLQRMDEEIQLAEKHSAYLKRQRKRIVQSQELETLEQSIYEEKERVDSLFAEHMKSESAEKVVVTSISQRFRVRRYSQFKQEYANGINYKEKTQKGEQLLELMLVIESIPDKINNAYERRREIEGLYTKMTFDAYNFEYVKTVKKRRLYDKVAIFLFEHYINELRNERDYKNLSPILEKIDKLQDRLIDLLHEDTIKLEKKIKRVKDPKVIETMINLKTD